MLLVFTFHFAGALLGSAVPAALPQIGYLGTSIFLVLAGYTAQSHLTHTLNIGAYWRSRFWRLYPLYAALLAVYVIGGLVLPGEGAVSIVTASGAMNVVTDLLMVTDVIHGTPIMDASWTLQDIALYSLIAPGVWLLSRIPPPGKRRCIFLFTLFLATVCVFSLTGFHRPRMALLLAGPLLYESFSASLSARTVITGLLVTVGIMAATLTGTRVWLMPLAVLVVWAVVRPLRTVWLGPGMAGEVLSWLGQRSYEFYICQGLVLVPTRIVMAAIGVPSWLATCLLFMICLQLNVGLAHVAHHFASQLKSAHPLDRLWIKSWPAGKSVLTRKSAQSEPLGQSSRVA